MAGAALHDRAGGFPGEHPGPAAQREQGRTAPGLRERAGAAQLRPLQHRLQARVRGVRRQAVRDHLRQLRVRPRPGGHDPPPQVCCGRGDGPRAVHHQRLTRILRRGEELPQAPQPQGPQGALRGPAVRPLAELPRERGCPLRRAVHAALPAPAALRREPDPGEGLQLRRGRGGQPRQVSLGRRPRSRSPPAIVGQLRQVPLGTEHHRPSVRRRGGGPPPAPVPGDGGAPDQDPHRDQPDRAARVRALGGGLHRAHLPARIETTRRSSPPTRRRSRSSSVRTPTGRPRRPTSASARSCRTCSS